MASIAKFDEWQNSAGVKRGTVLQTVHFPYGATWVGTSVSDGTGYFIDSPLSATITPYSATSKILIITDIDIGITTATSGYQQHFRIKKTVGATTTYPIIGNNESDRPRVSGSINNYGAPQYWRTHFSGVHQDTAGTTSSITYNIQVGGYSGSPIVYINRSEIFQVQANNYDSIGVSTLTLMEIQA